MLDSATTVDHATFTGIMPLAAGVQQVAVEVYRVFPLDSVNPPSGAVPTRADSPADVAFDSRAGSNGLSFSISVLNPSFAASNSVVNGIHPKPNQLTGGEGAASGEEARFDVTLDPPLRLPAGHYFLVPQVTLLSGQFLWLSAPRPIAAGTVFAPDLQTWIRNAALAPDWLRVGTDIVGGAPAPTFNGSFSLAGTVCTAIAVAPPVLGDGTVGSAYATTFVAAGGAGPYTFTVSGTLPGGIALAPGGALTGTPTATGSFPLVVTATDKNGCTGTASVTLTIKGAADAGGSGGGGPGSGSGTGTPPRITALHISPSSFRASRGTTVSYRDSLAAMTTLTVLRATRGVKQGRLCRKPARHRHGARCTRWVALGSFTHVDKAGANSVHLAGRLHGRKLAPGRYRLTLRPRLAGRAGGAVSARFRVSR